MQGSAVRGSADPAEGSTTEAREASLGRRWRALFERFGWADVLGLGLLLAGLLLLCRHLWSFTLDDAFINLRFSRNLANGHGLAWNPGAEPTEGYTTTLWILLMTVPHLLGVDAVLTAKLAGVASLVLVVAGLYAWGRAEGVDRPVLVGLLAAVAFSPAFALNAVQGMETTTATALVLGASAASVAYLRSGRRGAKVGLLAANLLLILIRPGLAVFGLGLVLGAFAVLHSSGDRSEAWGFLGQAAAANAAPALAFVAWRVWYFDQLLPNSVLVKQAGGLVSAASLEHAYLFGAVLLGPALVFVAAGLRDRWGSLGRRDLAAAAPSLAAVGLFVLALAAIDPQQAYLARFHLPATPALLVPALTFAAAIRLPASDLLGRGWSRSLRASYKRAGALVLVVLLLAAPLQTLTEAETAMRTSSSEHRVIAGEALASVDGEHRMFVTESGALPYVSGWTSTDYAGLTNTTIAREGFQPRHLDRFDPDLVMVRWTPSFANVTPELANALDGADYRLAAAVENTGRDHVRHLYLVDPASDEARAITCALLTLPVAYTERSEMRQRLTIDVEQAQPDREACQDDSQGRRLSGP